MLPGLSVIVPVHNGEAHLARSMPALDAAAAEYRAAGGEVEILVVNDGSTDSSATAASRHASRVIEMPPPASGPSKARNRGAREARFEIIAFMDADVAAKPDTLLKIGEFFQSAPDVHAMFGSYDDSPADPGIVSQYKNLFHHFVHQTSQENSSSFWAGCGAIRAEVFREIGGFPESYSRPAIEDIELGYTLISRGYQSRLRKDLQVTHLKKWTLLNLIKTDIMLRGVPWTRLLLRTRSFTRDLNLQTHNRVSVVLVYLILLSMIGSLKWISLIAGILPLGGFFIFLNIGLYQFFAEKRGFGFVLAAIPLHFLYYFYNGVSFIIGSILHFIETRRKAGKD